MKSAKNLEAEVLRPIAQAWASRINAAHESKRRFQEIADKCDQFFRGETRFMWEDAFRSKHLPGIAKPSIMFTLNKAFELVAIFGPTLFWQYPGRQVSTHRGVDPLAVAAALGIPEDDPLVAEIARESNDRIAIARVRNAVAEIYLNWSQSQQPPNGLHREGELCITEGLVKGRACGWTQDYSFPGSDEKFTGSFYDSVDNFFIDPDCTDPELRTATWIARKHCTPAWELERTFDLPKDTLRGYAETQSEEASSRSSRDTGNQNTNDLVIWYEIWSRGGIGSKMRDSESNAGESIDRAVGDFVYLCLVPSAPMIISAQPNQVFRANQQKMRELFSWRTANYGSPWEIWRDGQWPVCLLDFYPVPNSAWPLAPMAPGLGELIAMSVLMVAYCESAWEGRKQLIAVANNAADAIRVALKSCNATEIVDVNKLAGEKSIRDVVSILERPSTKNDILNAIQLLAESFDKRTGLSEILYAMSSRQIRVAADANTRQENASIRPEQMARKVAAWMSRLAANELSLAADVVSARSLTPLLGPIGAAMWRQHIETVDTQSLMREMICLVEATDVMRPNREKSLANLQALSQYVLPPFQRYAEATGDSRPLNGFLQSIAEAMDHDASDWNMGPWQPQPDPAAQQMAQQQGQLEMQNLAADTQLKQAQAAAQVATVEKSREEPLLKRMEFQVDSARKLSDMQIKQAESVQKLRMQQAGHTASLLQNEESHSQGMSHREADHVQSMIHSEEDHEQSLQQEKEDHQVNMKLRKAESAEAAGKPEDRKKQQ